jgi:hypothetical protein
MLSSISSSDASAGQDSGWFASVVLLACAGVIFVGAESVCRQAVPRISRIERRTVGEMSSALTMRPEADRVNVLVVGNSLLLYAVNFETVRGALGPGVNIQRLVVEDTRLLDWYYGLRRLVASGSNPDWVVIVLHPEGFVSSEVRKEYFAYRLMDGRDLLDVQREAGLTNTVTSNYAFANVSAFFGLRAEVHKVVLSTVFSDLESLTALMTQRRGVKASLSGRESVVRSRLKALDDFASASGVRVAVAIPPTGTTNAELAAELQQQARGAGIPVLLPVEPGALPAKYYADGFHLNEEGAKVFTPVFAAALRQLMNGHRETSLEGSGRTKGKEWE